MADRVLPAAPFTTPMTKVKPPKASSADLVEAAVRYAREGGAGFGTEAERNIAELGARRAISLMTREEGFYDPSFVSESADPDTFGLIVADCLPDDDDGDEEPGAMCKRALAKASTSVDLIRQVAIKMCGSDDRADFERSYPLEQKKALLETAREIIELVRGSSMDGSLPDLGVPKVLGGEVVS